MTDDVVHQTVQKPDLLTEAGKAHKAEFEPLLDEWALVARRLMNFHLDGDGNIWIPKKGTKGESEIFHNRHTDEGNAKKNAKLLEIGLFLNRSEKNPGSRLFHDTLGSEVLNSGLKGSFLKNDGYSSAAHAHSLTIDYATRDIIDHIVRSAEPRSERGAVHTKPVKMDPISDSVLAKDYEKVWDAGEEAPSKIAWILKERDNPIRKDVDDIMERMHEDGTEGGGIHWNDGNPDMPQKYKNTRPMNWDKMFDLPEPKGDVMEAVLNIENPKIHNYKGQAYREQTYYDVIRKAKEEGHDGVIFKNTFDGGSRTKSDTIYVAFDKEQITVLNLSLIHI